MAFAKQRMGRSYCRQRDCLSKGKGYERGNKWRDHQVFQGSLTMEGLWRETEGEPGRQAWPILEKKDIARFTKELTPPDLPHFTSQPSAEWASSTLTLPSTCAYFYLPLVRQRAALTLLSFESWLCYSLSCELKQAVNFWKPQFPQL